MAHLKENVSLAIEGFVAKKRYVNERLKQPLLPLLVGRGASAPYLYEKNSSYNLSFVGLSEAIEAHTGLRIERDKAAPEFGLKVLQELSKSGKTASEESGMRICVSQQTRRRGRGQTSQLLM